MIKISEILYESHKISLDFNHNKTKENSEDGIDITIEQVEENRDNLPISEGQ